MADKPEIKPGEELVPQPTDAPVPGNMQVMMQARVMATGFSGPLPPPQIIEGYNSVIPNAGEKILQMAIDQGNHRRFIETKIVEAQIDIQKRGQSFAFGIAIFGLASSVGCAYLNQPWVASIIGGATLVGMISIFIRGKAEQEKELNQKRQELPPGSSEKPPK